MRIGYDPTKNAWNMRERGLSFDDVALLDWSTAAIRQDRRKDYGEDRFQALVEGSDSKPYTVVFTMRGETMWIISFRRTRDTERTTLAKKPDPFMTDEENPEWTEEAAGAARPFGKIFPEQLASWKNRGGRPPIDAPKIHIGFRLAADVVDGIRATGSGYNSRVEKVLREAIAKGRL